MIGGGGARRSLVSDGPLVIGDWGLVALDWRLVVGDGALVIGDRGSVAFDASLSMVSMHYNGY